MKYLLSTGEITGKIEKYILDLFKLNMAIYPGDIPNSSIGFNFVITDVKKSELPGEIKSRITSLITRLQSRFSGITISLESLELLSEELARVVVRVNQESEQIELVI